MTIRATGGSLAGVAFGLLIAALPSFLVVAWLPFGFLAAGIVVGLFAGWVWIRERHERERRHQLVELLQQVAVVGEAVVELRHGPTFGAWRQSAEDTLRVAIDPAAAEAFATADAAPGEVDPMAILAGASFGSAYVSSLRDVAARIDTVVIQPDFDPSTCSIFDPVAWERDHARRIAWEAQNGAPCPWCGERIYPSNSKCPDCGAEVGSELAFR